MFLIKLESNQSFGAITQDCVSSELSKDKRFFMSLFYPSFQYTRSQNCDQKKECLPSRKKYLCSSFLLSFKDSKPPLSAKDETYMSAVVNMNVCSSSPAVRANKHTHTRTHTRAHTHKGLSGSVPTGKCLPCCLCHPDMLSP